MKSLVAKQRFYKDKKATEEIRKIVALYQYPEFNLDSLTLPDDVISLGQQIWDLPSSGIFTKFKGTIPANVTFALFLNHAREHLPIKNTRYAAIIQKIEFITAEPLTVGFLFIKYRNRAYFLPFISRYPWLLDPIFWLFLALPGLLRLS